MKKIIFIIMLLITLTGCNKEMTNKDIPKENKESLQIKESNNSNSEETKTDENEEKVTNDTTKETQKETNKQNTSNKKTNESNNYKKTTEAKAQQKVVKEETKEENSKVKEKHTCTNNDSNYVKWKNQFLSDNKSTRLFDTYEEAYNKATEIKDKYYYGFIVQTSPTNYSDDECSKTLYTMQLFVPQGICENNPMTYLPNDINLDTTPLNTIDYLKKIGYECAGKNL